MIIKLIGKKNQKILTLEEAKEHLNLLSNSRDNYIDSLLYAVTDNIENYLQKDLVDTTYEFQIFDSVEIGEQIHFPNSPIYKVLDVKVFEDDVEVSGATYSNTDEYITFDQLPASYDKIQITFKKGVEDANDLPEDIKQAAKLQLHDFFNFRGTIYVGKSINQLNKAVERLLQPHKNITFL